MTIGSKIVWTRLHFYIMLWMVGQSISEALNLWADPTDRFYLCMLALSLIASALNWHMWRRCLRIERHQPALDFWKRQATEEANELKRLYADYQYDEFERLSEAWEVTMLRWERELDEAYGKKKR